VTVLLSELGWISKYSWKPSIPSPSESPWLFTGNIYFYWVRRGDLFVMLSVRKNRDLTMHESDVQTAGYTVGLWRQLWRNAWLKKKIYMYEITWEEVWETMFNFWKTWPCLIGTNEQSVPLCVYKSQKVDAHAIRHKMNRLLFASICVMVLAAALKQTSAVSMWRSVQLWHMTISKYLRQCSKYMYRWLWLGVRLAERIYDFRLILRIQV